MRKDGLNTPAIALTGVVSTLVVFAVILLIMAWFHSIQNEETYRKQVLPPSEDLNRLVFEQQASLSHYRWVDREQGVVAIPIERAMDLVVRELGAASSTDTPSQGPPSQGAPSQGASSKGLSVKGGAQ